MLRRFYNTPPGTWTELGVGNETNWDSLRRGERNIKNSKAFNREVYGDAVGWTYTRTRTGNIESLSLKYKIRMLCKSLKLQLFKSVCYKWLALN